MLILASQSPRRRELLSRMDIEFVVADVYDTDETLPKGVALHDIPAYLAHKKSVGYPHPLLDQQILLTADTLVLHQNQLLGKPHNRNEAIAMLQSLSASWHEVITAVCLRNNKTSHTFSELSRVQFSDLRLQDIVYYVDKYQPYDKAGAYGIQEWIAYVGIQQIEGCYYNIMGLPLHRLNKELRKLIPNVN